MKKGIIVASFGSSYLDATEKSFDFIKNTVQKEYRDFKVVDSFSSKIVRSILKKRDNIDKFDTNERIEQLKAEGIEDIKILSLYIVPGVEYEKATNFGFPRTLSLLEDQKYYDDILEALNIVEKDEFVILVSHGSPVEANKYYDEFQQYIWDKGFKNVYISSLESNDKNEIIKKITNNKVRLLPFLIVAGDHANNDVFGNEDSYLSDLKDMKIEVVEDRKGLGERAGIVDIFLRKLKEI